MTRLVFDKPARQIGPNHRSLTGTVQTRERPIPVESSLERDFVILFDLHPSVVEIRQQPLRLDYQDAEGQNRRYYPDFFVKEQSGRKHLIEVKYRSDLKENWAVLKPKFRAAFRYAKQHGMRFSLFTEVEIRRGSFLKNANFLRYYRHIPADPAIEAHLISTLAVLGNRTTPEALLQASYRTLENRLVAIPYLWRLLALGSLRADFSLPLTMASEIWMSPTTEDTWQDPHFLPSGPVR